MKDIETTQTSEPTVTEPVETRRDAVEKLARMSAGIGLASIPVALATMVRKLAAQVPPSQAVFDALNSALVLEYLQSEFYTKAITESTIVYPNPSPRGGLTTIRDQQLEHVEALRNVLGGQAIAKPSFDFTAGGKYPDVFSNYSVFLTLATSFEDITVRGYKGILPAVMSNDAILSLVMSMHSVEARHASHVRRLPGSYGIQGWIAENQPNAPAAVAPVYVGEDATIHNSINLLNINLSAALGTNVLHELATEAFDEPLSAEEVSLYIGQFIVQVNPLNK